MCGDLMVFLVKNSHSYFSESLQKALEINKLNLSESAQIYLIYMLDDFISAERTFAGIERKEQIYFTDLLNRALDSSDQEALRIFRYMGDISLYLLGFFKKISLNKKMPSSYYISMGSLAYSQASYISRLYAANNAAIFLELSEQFIFIVETFKNMSFHNSSNNNFL